jgi:large subunit ribosomal protein L4
MVKTLDNKDVGEVALDPSIFDVALRPDILARVVHWQLMKRRAGTHKTKGISDVQGTTRKPFKQKGTGRARQGSLRSPHMRGGAVIFGPVVRDHGFSLPKKVRQLGLKVALSSKRAEGALIVVDSLGVSGKTQDLLKKIKGLGITSALFVGGESVDPTFQRASAGLVGIDALPHVGLNVYDVLRHKVLVLAQDVLPLLGERLK